MTYTFDQNDSNSDSQQEKAIDPVFLNRTVAMEEINEETTPFTRITVAMYLHDTLISLADGSSLKQVRLLASQQALETLSRWRSLGLEEPALHPVCCYRCNPNRRRMRT
jgi:hypothetical protein